MGSHWSSFYNVDQLTEIDIKMWSHKFFLIRAWSYFVIFARDLDVRTTAAHHQGNAVHFPFIQSLIHKGWKINQMN